VQLGQHQEAIRSYGQALEIDPNLYKALGNCGVALSQLDETEQAIAIYQEAIKIRPNYYQAWYNCGIAFNHLGQYEKAIESYNRAINIQPDAYVFYHRACTYALWGKVEDSLDSLQYAIGLDPKQFIKFADQDPDFNSIRQNSVFTTLLEISDFSDYDLSSL
jgi:tetratricopeptide (TPR) repeat protein